MLIESALYQILKNSGTIANIVHGRIFSGVLPLKLDTFPAIVYRPSPRGGRKVVRTIDGGCALVEQPLYIFSAAKTNYGEAARLDDAIFHALDEYPRSVISDLSMSPPDSIRIEAVLTTDLAHSYAYVDDTHLHQFITEYLFHYIDPIRQGGRDALSPQ
jgi:hypothetical protein